MSFRGIVLGAGEGKTISVLGASYTYTHAVSGRNTNSPYGAAGRLKTRATNEHVLRRTKDMETLRWQKTWQADSAETVGE